MVRLLTGAEHPANQGKEECSEAGKDDKNAAASYQRGQGVGSIHGITSFLNARRGSCHLDTEVSTTRIPDSKFPNSKDLGQALPWLDWHTFCKTRN